MTAKATNQLDRSRRLARGCAKRRRVRAHSGACSKRGNQLRSSSECSARCGASIAATSTLVRILGRLPTTADWVLQGPGENAGAIDIGDGLAAVFKVESHNHPSAVEPYEGAATGVGGIVRDIFTMGARPVAILNSLRFGPLDQPRNVYLFENVVAGIGGYGNCLGIPTVGGEVFFDPSFSGNPLVNAMCIGIVEADGIVRAKASGVGNLIMLDRRRHRSRRLARRDLRIGRRSRGIASWRDSGWQSVSGKTAPGSLPRAPANRRCRGNAGSRRSWSDQLDRRDCQPRRSRRRDRRRHACHAASRA